VQTQRFATPNVAERYPYPIVGAVPWQRTDGGFRAEIAFPVLEPGHILVPSFAMLGAGDYGFRFVLEAEGTTWPLDPVHLAEANGGTVTSAVSTHIDCFHTHTQITNAVLVLEVAADTVEGRAHLFTVALRPLRIEPDAGTRTTLPIAVPPVSQLTAPRGIRHRICSPTCVNMVLSSYGIATHNGELTPMCRHVATEMYGVWPLNLWAASRKGALGAVELFCSLDEVAGALDHGLPVVASIRFHAGELPGAPLTATGGHLVVVTELGEHDVAVNDPAGRGIDGVPRRYPRAALASAWLTRRGAAYVILPP